MPSTKDDKRRRAIERQESRTRRTPQQQLAILDGQLGKGVGAAKERARLAKLIARPEEAIAKEFAGQWQDDNIVTVALGNGQNGLAIMVYAIEPDKVDLPKEFKGLEIVVRACGLRTVA